PARGRHYKGFATSCAGLPIRKEAWSRPSRVTRWPIAFNHDATGKELCPAGLDWNDPSIKSVLKAGTMVVPSDQWPIFMYLNGDYDPERPWAGLLRGHLLVKAFKHIFISPSSVDDSGRSTKSSNAAIHGMTSVTLASITYVATLVRFSLGSRGTFSRTDTVTDSQNFYNVILAFLTHPEERENANELLAWWNRRVFPHAVALYRAPTDHSDLAKLMAGPVVVACVAIAVLTVVVIVPAVPTVHVIHVVRAIFIFFAGDAVPLILPIL
ncbi:hypothetical protein LXA43DRAFT_1113436, partial [Ganoderma leucocontextum]